METYQLKKIIIIILALVNLALLGLLGRNELQQKNAERETLQQLQSLYASSGVELTIDTLPRQKSSASSLAVGHEEKEAAFAEALLGSVSGQESGSSTLYSSDSGTLRFRRNSFFELTMSRPFLSREDTLAFFAGCGYTLSDGGAGDTLRLAQTIDGRTVAGNTVFLLFRDGLLLSASGYYVCARQEYEVKELCSATDALASFLRYMQENGIVCSSIRSIQPAWQLSAETLFQSTLLPVWLIETDSSYYFTNTSGNQIFPLFSV